MAVGSSTPKGRRSPAPSTSSLGIETRLLPKATPELNAMDQLWKHVKRDTLASRAMHSVEDSALNACRYTIDMPARERLRKAGIESGRFWLT
jgi:transposase